LDVFWCYIDWVQRRMIGNRAKRGFLNEATDDIQAVTGGSRGEIKPPSTNLQLATEEEWAALGLSGERVYTSFNPLGNNPKKK